MEYFYRWRRAHQLKIYSWQNAMFPDKLWRVQSKNNLVQEEEIPMHIYRKIRSIFDKIRPVVSHLDVWLHEKTMVSKNIGESLKPPQSQLRKEALFVSY